MDSIVGGNKPKCGQYCWGPKNLCIANDGCKCIADSFQGPGSTYFTGTVKLSWATYTQGRRLSGVESANTSSLVQSSDLLNSSDLFDSPQVLNASAAYKSYLLNSSDTSDLLEVPDTTTNTTVADLLAEVNSAAAAEAAGSIPCPCNCTYISYACCGSANGFVYEVASNKLGMLMPPASSCCNSTTGDIEPGNMGKWNFLRRKSFQEYQ